MARELEPIEIGGMPELVRLAEEVRESGTPRVLRKGGRDVAVLAPPGRARISQEDLAAWDQAVGSWADLDVRAVIEHVYRARVEGSRPADRP